MTSTKGTSKMKATALMLALAVGSASPVLAHTSYMLPSFFTANTQDYITVESSFTETFFQPEVMVDSNDFHVVLPDGSRTEFDAVGKHKQLVVLESPLRQDGTYRFTTGVRWGRVTHSALINGEWKPVPGEAPAGAKVKSSQTETVADVYVTKKAPTRAPVDKQIGRLVIQPVTHPSDVALDAGFKLKVLFDGKPLGDQTIVLDRGGSEYDDTSSHRDLKTAPDGSLDLKFEKPGVYILMTRHKADAPAGSPTDERSYTTSLTFEVQR